MYSFPQASLCILVYFVLCVLVAFGIRILFHVPTELFRKLLHLILIGSLAVWLYAYAVWWHALLAVLIFMALVYPILTAAERLKGYSDFVTERNRGELKKSFLLVFFMFSLILIAGWGILNDKNLCLASLLAWGFGDAAAALVGKRFGRHFIEGAHIEGRKSLEGCVAMFVISFLSVLLVLLNRDGLPTAACPVIAVVVAAVSTVVELFSMKGNDTIFCPLAAMAVLLPLTNLFGVM